MSAEAFGLFDPSAFRVGAGATCPDRHAAFYFHDQVVALATGDPPLAPIDAEARPFHALRRWSDAHAAAPVEAPPLVWVDAERSWRDVRFDAAAGLLIDADGPSHATLTARHALNRSWFDDRSATYFGAQAVALRGNRRNDAIEIRSLWPESFRLGPRPPAVQVATLRDLASAGMQPGAGFATHTLWQRKDEPSWLGRAVLAFIVNGAQGDDDEAHAGHFAIATGRIAADGAMNGWLVHNFYALDSESEKGILAAPVPLDVYQGQLNAGQSWYRPSGMLVAVLDHDRAGTRVQSGLARLFRQFWRHQLAYYHPTANCTSFSIDALRALGLDVKRRPPPTAFAAKLGFPLLVLRERSLARAKQSFDYAVTDVERLLPLVALEAVHEALVALIDGPAHAHGPLARELASDLAALAWVALPQFPSSRASGAPPVTSLAQYRARVPRDRSRWQVVPVPPRPFPEALRDPDLLPPVPHPSHLAVRTWAFVLLGVAALALILPTF